MDWLLENSMIIIFAMLVVSFGYIGIYTYLQDKKRREALRMLAPQMGFSYIEKNNSFIESHKNIKIFSRGRSQSFTNVMEGERNGVGIMIGDYQFVTGSGKNSSHHCFTLCIILDDSMALPNFFLRQEHGFMDSLGKMLGGQDINFTEDHKFSSAFVLQGIIEAEVRSLFTDKVRQAFLKFANTSTQVEGQDDYLIIHQAEALAPQKWGSLLKNTFEIYDALKVQEDDLLD